MDAIGPRIVAIASLFVDWVQEASGHLNDGIWVRAIQGITGNKPPAAWCASFVTFVLDIAYCGKNPLARSASCTALYRDALAKGYLTTTPVPGDILLVMNGPDTAHHTGIVTSKPKGGAIASIEGNSNDDGSREGWKVCARPRRNVKGLTFIHLPEG